jgi:hypothetical protein
MCLASGQWQVEVRIFCETGRQMKEQDCLLPDYYATQEDAFEAGRTYGLQWVDTLVASAPPRADSGQP